MSLWYSASPMAAPQGPYWGAQFAALLILSSSAFLFFSVSVSLLCLDPVPALLLRAQGGCVSRTWKEPNLPSYPDDKIVSDGVDLDAKLLDMNFVLRGVAFTLVALTQAPPAVPK